MQHTAPPGSMGKKNEGNGHLMANGQPKMNGALDEVGNETEKEENIFLFVPNLIGLSRRRDCLECTTDV